ncbi:exodeoxyribonuclease I [Corallincola luteus]|uniref:Exodeoxyribonuclease I n=1 Tax=Corallincola luteus TaxID=1775177 RepID=A0ABY2AIN1_9GAMM|nr:exodeoxyribonuclease I [Corallincola luteus]TCI02529.1 exodeoxyribonuclease I [Corallincola luteus]
MKQNTILWHDYETFGADPKRDRPVQFAAIRTDEDLNEIDEPLMFYCAPADDVLPAPMACLVTGITPQLALANGIPEVEFIKRVNTAFSVPGTCSAGYNTIRFDDEVTRNTLYRNLMDPYAREWKNGNSRWDIIDMVRTCYALRPEGIEWPTREDGAPSFKLEHLTAANSLAHGQAHDALSDVRATIAMAKLIKEKQPRLYDYLYGLRSKRELAKLIDVVKMQPLLHVSSKIPAAQGCCSWVLPLMFHPTNKNSIVVADLNCDPTPLLKMSTEQVLEALYAKADAGLYRPPLKLVHLNKCPVLAPAKMLTAENAERLGIDRDACLQHLSWWRSNAQIKHTLSDVYEAPYEGHVDDVDLNLYQGFASNHDKATMEVIHQTKVEDLPAITPNFEDPQLAELFFRFKARNYPHLLSEQEQLRWQAFREKRLAAPNPYALDIQTFSHELEALAMEHQNNEKKMAILHALYDYAQSL